MRAGRVGIAAAALLLAIAALMLTGVKPAAASPLKVAHGVGEATEFTCPGHQEVGSTAGAIDFSASRAHGLTHGFGFIEGTTVDKDFSITRGNMNRHSYSLTGIVRGHQLCGSTQTSLPSVVTLSGPCGTGVSISYSDTNGESGTFTGNVACT
jgi:hypothetical protein